MEARACSKVSAPCRRGLSLPPRPVFTPPRWCKTSCPPSVSVLTDLRILLKISLSSLWDLRFLPQISVSADRPQIFSVRSLSVLWNIEVSFSNNLPSVSACCPKIWISVSVTSSQICHRSLSVLNLRSSAVPPDPHSHFRSLIHADKPGPSVHGVALLISVWYHDRNAPFWQMRPLHWEILVAASSMGRRGCCTMQMLWQKLPL